MLAGTVDWRGLNFCTAKALLHGCVVTQLRDAILDCWSSALRMGRWFKFNLVHQFRVNRAEFNTKLFRVNELYGQDFHPVENSFGAVWMSLRLYKCRRHSNSRTGSSRLCHFTVEVCINCFTGLCFGLKLFKYIMSTSMTKQSTLDPRVRKNKTKTKQTNNKQCSSKRGCE